MAGFIDALEEIKTEHRNLLNIALNKKVSKVEPVAKKSAAFLPALPFSKPEKSNLNVSKAHAEYLSANGYINESGKPTEKYYEKIESAAEPFKGNLTPRDLFILKNVNTQNENWENFIKSQGSPALYRRCMELKKANYFNDKGCVIESVKNLFQKERNNNVSSKFSSHHVSLMNVIVENKNKINEEIYNKYQFKTKWCDQVKKINWMIKNEILTENLEITDFGKKLRLSKIKPISEGEISERDLKILNWIQNNDDKCLGLISKRSAFSRIYRFQAAGFLDNNFNMSEKLHSIVKNKKIELKNDNRPIWIKENRKARFDDLNDKEIKLIKTLALETPFLSEKQINNRFFLNSNEIDKLKNGILISKNILVKGNNIYCYALNWDTREILKPAGINRALRGKFQKDSHVYHDLMVYESIQHTKELMHENGNEVVEIVHERSQFQAKISANDNKGMCHADSVVIDKSGGETAVEYGNYSVERMMHKINGFSQNNVMVYSDSQSMIHSYQSTYTQLTKTSNIKNKNVKFIYLPSVQM